MAKTGALQGVSDWAVDRVQQIFSRRDGIIADLATLKAAHAADAAARHKAIAAAQAEVDKIEEPRRRLERLQAEALALGASAQAEVDKIENDLRAEPGRELAKFAALVDRVYSRLRTMAPPRAIEQYNAITEERRVVNLDEIEKHLALGPVLVRIRAEIHRELWRLDAAALKERLTVLRHELAIAVEETALESEAA